MPALFFLAAVKPRKQPPTHISSIAQQQQLLSLPAPAHALCNVLYFAATAGLPRNVSARFSLGYYAVVLLPPNDCRIKYGQQYVDFTQGRLSFLAPGQLLSLENLGAAATDGWMLSIHPALLRHHPLGQRIGTYRFFSYSQRQGLRLSPDDEHWLTTLVQQVARESAAQGPAYSQDVLLSYLELLLNYANRCYQLQDRSPPLAPIDLLARVETLLEYGFSPEALQRTGLPTVRSLAAQLHLSPAYLSQLLRQHSGKSTQQLIHEKLLATAQLALATSTRSVSEIAYELGFSHPQSFTKLFKQKTNRTPLEFRQALW